MKSKTPQKNTQTTWRSRRMSSGLTIVETLVAITILVSAVTGPLVIYSSSITNARIAQDRTIASYLAQEGLEFMMYRINSNFNDGTDWLVPDTNPCVGGACQVDAFRDTITVCPSGSCALLRVDPLSGLFNYLAGPESIYRREIAVQPNFGGNPANALISVSVLWQGPENIESFTLEQHIFQWR